MVIERDVHFPSGGETLYGLLTHPADDAARGTVLLVHGFLSEGREFSGLPRRLAELGWASLTFDRRGHGRSTGSRGTLSKKWAVEDVQAAIEFLKTCPEAPAPFGAIGHSMGAAWLVAALPHVPDVKAVVLAAPMRNVTDQLTAPGEERAYRLAAKASKLKHRMGLGHLVVPYKFDYGQIFKDAEAARRAAELGILQRVVSLENVDELLAIDAEAWAREVRQPVLGILGAHDRLIKNANSRRVLAALAGPTRELVLDCGHSLFGDCHPEVAARAVHEFFMETLAAASHAADAATA